jgi:hypothetical protein
MDDNLNKLKALAVCLSVVLIGIGGFVMLFNNIFSEELSKDSCELCLELNEGLLECEDYEPINISWLLDEKR